MAHAEPSSRGPSTGPDAGMHRASGGAAAWRARVACGRMRVACCLPHMLRGGAEGDPEEGSTAAVPRARASSRSCAPRDA